MPLSLLISKAVKQDANQIADLVNSAYRGESSRQGWTTEADFLDGSRTDPEEIIQLISSKDSIILVCKAETELVATKHPNQPKARFTSVDHLWTTRLQQLAISPAANL